MSHSFSLPGVVEKASQLDLAVIVPTLNEHVTIANVLQSIAENLQSIRYTICVVDAGSTDGTLEIINDLSKQNSNIFLIHQVKEKSGCQRGAGSRMALEWLMKNTSHTVFTEVDSDGAHSVKELMNGVVTISLSNFDVVIASKYVYGSQVIGRSFYRRTISYCYSQLARMLFHRGLKDYSNSYRFYSLKAAQHILAMKPMFTSPMYLFEMLATCLSNQLKMVELPSIYVERNIGSSKVTSTDVLKGFFSMLSISVKYYMSYYRQEDSA
jgi:dolichol-phosphate mannosyltransferase